jgi:2,4-dienoyl-CoA reductase-like NADH-dependent reductase (Old Yellow Enzyme family)
MPGVPGLFLESQIPGWKTIASAIHTKGGIAYMQLWHSGRANIPHMTGTPTYSASATPWDDADERFMFPPPHTTQSIRYADFPPEEMSVEHIKKTIADYVRTAKWAVEECGFDGVEVHGGNGYLVEQFLASNVNKRTDAYGGTYEKRCTFALELMSELSKAIGEERLAIRLTPFGLFNQIRSEQRLETWQTLCRKLKEAHPGLSYVSFVEPVSWSAFEGMVCSCSLTPADDHFNSDTNKCTAKRKSRVSSTRGASAPLT